MGVLLGGPSSKPLGAPGECLGVPGSANASGRRWWATLPLVLRLPRPPRPPALPRVRCLCRLLQPPRLVLPRTFSPRLWTLRRPALAAPPVPRRQVGLHLLPWPPAPGAAPLQPLPLW